MIGGFDGLVFLVFWFFRNEFKFVRGVKVRENLLLDELFDSEVLSNQEIVFLSLLTTICWGVMDSNSLRGDLKIKKRYGKNLKNKKEK